MLSILMEKGHGRISESCRGTDSNILILPRRFEGKKKDHPIKERKKIYPGRRTMT